MSDYRIEYDSMGEVRVPAGAYYSAQTQRAVENFPISGWRLPPALIRAMGLVKYACAVANRDLGKLTGTGKKRLNEKQVDALLEACREVADGKLDDQFPVDVFQTGSGTSSNMNVNEVIANRAIEMLGGDRFDAKKPIHPNDHVNMGQSTNDTFPTAIHVAVAMEIQNQLIAGPAAAVRRAGHEGARVGQHHQDRPHAPDGRHAAATGPGVWRLRSAAAAVGGAGRASVGQCAGVAGRRHGCRVGHQHASGIWPPSRAGAGQGDRAFRSSRRPITSKPTLSATAWSSATAICGRSP